MWPNKNRDRLPPELRRQPWYKRLAKKDADKIVLSNDQMRSPFTAPGHVRFLRSFDRSINQLIDLILRLITFVRGIRIRAPLWLTVPLAFGVGIGIGAIVMRQRHFSSEVILAIRGKTITQSQFRHQMEIQIGPQILNKMVEDQLLLQFAKEKQRLPSREQVAQRVQLFRSKAGFETLARERHIQDADLIQEAQVQLIRESITLKDVAVTDKEALDYYRANCKPTDARSQFYIPETAHLSIITNSVEENVRKADVALKTHGFAEVAKSYSLDRTASVGGKMAEIRRGRTLFAMEPALERAIFSLKPGERLPPRKFLSTWVLIQMDQLEPARTIPFEQVSKLCYDGARALKSQRSNVAQVSAEFEEFRKQADIQVFWDQYYYDLTGKPKQTASSATQ